MQGAGLLYEHPSIESYHGMRLTNLLWGRLFISQDVSCSPASGEMLDAQAHKNQKGSLDKSRLSKIVIGNSFVK
ncbi:hypothetical protein INR49_029270 [Caranx melampygus]|nr:hypothetical protein INR49_029270 [Caranx melampygus]